jgi:hypothetical protein
MNGLFSLCGYDVTLIERVGRGERAFFVISALLSLVAVLLAGAGMAYGFVLTLGPVAAAPAFVLAALFVLNLLRLQHAGSGYPLHLPIEAIHGWRPGFAGVFILLVFGVLLSQPIVFLLQKPWLDPVVAARVADAAAVRAALGLEVAPVADGLILRGRAAWSEHLGLSALLTLLFSLLLASPAILRFLGAAAVRDYESERWIADRILVDDEWAVARDVIEETLVETAPGWQPPLVVPFADPPYNTRPLIFGLDPADLVEGRVRFVRLPRAQRAATPAVPTPATPWWATLTPVAPAPTTAPPAFATPDAPPMAPTTAVQPTTTAATTTATTTTTPTTTAPTMAMAPDTTRPTTSAGDDVTVGTVVDVGRLRAAEARRSIKVMALCARYLEVSAGEVLQTLRAAPDDAPLHLVFPAWGRLPTLLLKPASVALELGLAPLIAIAVGRPADQIERRLRAVPGDRKVSSVFAPELARRLLREKPGAGS